LKERQNRRRTVLFVSMMLIPVVINYYSPIMPVEGAAEGVVVGSLVFFGLLFTTSLFMGRGYCGWLCPFGGWQEAMALASSKRTNSPLGHRVKWVLWLAWIGVITYTAMDAGGFRMVNVLYHSEAIISLDEPARYYYLYFPVLGLGTLAMTVLGKRAWCHYICWAGNFATLGNRVKNTLRYPSLHLESAGDCARCGSCTRVCAKSLDVQDMADANDFTDDECTLCGECVDTCPRSNIKYAWRWSRPPGNKAPQ